MPRAMTGSAVHLYVRALGDVRRFWPHLGVILVLGLLVVPLNLLNPLPLKIIVDCVLGQKALPAPFAGLVGREAALPIALSLGICLALINPGIRFAELMFREWVGERIISHFRSRLFERALRISVDAEDASAIQDFAYRIANDAPALQWAALYGLLPLATSLTSLAGTLWVTCRISPTLAAIAIATALPALALIQLTQQSMRHQWHKVRESESRAQTVVQEALSGRSVTGIRHERHGVTRYNDATATAERAKLSALRKQGALSTVLGLSTALGSIGIVCIGVKEVQANLLSVGDLLMIIAYVAQLYDPVQQIGNHITGQQHAVASAERAFQLLDRAPAKEFNRPALPRPPVGRFGTNQPRIYEAAD